MTALWTGHDVLVWSAALIFLALCAAVFVGSHAIASMLQSGGSSSVLEAASGPDERAAARLVTMLEVNGNLEGARDAYESLAESDNPAVAAAARRRGERLTRLVRLKMFVEYVSNIEFSRQLS